MKILGAKLKGHDSAIFLLDLDNRNVFAISTERITRIKHDGDWIKPIIDEYYENLKDIDYVVHSFGKVDKNLDSYRKKERVKVIKTLIKNMDFKSLFSLIARFIREKYEKHGDEEYIKAQLFPKDKFNNLKNIEYRNHHLCHAVSAYYFSPFNDKEALIFTLDGYGDGEYSTLYIFNKNKWKKVSGSLTINFGVGKCIKTFWNNNWYFTSIGTIYSIFTEVLGFTPNSDEGKTEALAAYGKPNMELYNLLKNAFKLNKEKLRWEHDYNILKKLYDLEYLRQWKEKIGDENFAATIQRWLENTIVEYLNTAYERYKIPRLAMAGGVCANVIMNLHIFERTPFEEIYIFPAMGDDGTAAGAAVLKAIELGYDVSWLKDLEMPYWGPNYSKEDVEKELKKEKWKDKIIYKYIGEDWPELAAKMIADGKIISVYQGKMEFGPRALGNRSVLADPRNPETRDKINSTVKRRPWFQPFCPSVLEKERERLFEKSYNHKYMAIAFRIKKEFWDKLPSAMHIDGTARPQFVEENNNPNYYKLIKKFKELTGYGIVVNTSFNLHGRTIVRTPEDAITDFIDCNIDAMFIEGFLVERK